MEKLIDFDVCDIADTKVWGCGVVIVNPKYGKRMGADKDLAPLYRRIGDFFKKKLSRVYRICIHRHA